MIRSRRIMTAGAALAALLGLLAAGCDSHTDKISDIVNNPSGFSGHDATVAGEVTKVYELPLGLTDIAAYRVTDGTGQIWVISHAGAPREGDKVGLKGIVRPAGSVGGMALGTVIEEHERKMR